MLLAKFFYTNHPLIVGIAIFTDQSGTLFVEYGSSQTGWYRSAACDASVPGHYIIKLVRLRAQHRYQFRVILFDTGKRIQKTKEESFVTRSLPPSLQAFRLILKGRFSEEAGVIVLCINGVVCSSSFFQGYIGIDQDAQIVWYYKSDAVPAAGDFFQMKNRHMVITVGQSLGVPVTKAQINQAAQMRIIDAFGTTFAQQPLICQTYPNLIGTKGAVLATFGWTHASWQDPGNPNVIMHLGLVLRDPFYDAGLAPPGIKMQLGETIREWIPSLGVDTIKTSAFELLDPLTYRGPLSNDSIGVPLDCSGQDPGMSNMDWTHGNAISRLNATSDWVISQRDTSSVLILDAKTFALKYKFGVTQPSDFKFPNPDDLFYGQHDFHELKNGNMICFDDGTGRPPSQGGPYARAIEYKLCYKTRRITKVWEFRPRKNIECQDGGSSRRLINGHTIVDFGATNLTTKHVFEAGCKNNTAIAHLQVIGAPDNSWLLYRAVPIESLSGETRIERKNKRFVKIK